MKFNDNFTTKKQGRYSNYSWDFPPATADLFL